MHDLFRRVSVTPFVYLTALPCYSNRCCVWLVRSRATNKVSDRGYLSDDDDDDE